MFKGDSPDLRRSMQQAVGAARRLEHPRVGSEHLLLALAEDSGALGALLASHGVTADAVRAAVVDAAPAGAAAASDRDMLFRLGISIDALVGSCAPAFLDRPPLNEPLFPLGVVRARRRCARRVPPLGLDFQAAYEASLRLALARAERQHRPEHLALTLVALDPGVSWVLARVGADTAGLLAGLAEAYRPPRRNWVLQVKRDIAKRARNDRIVARYQHTAGRGVVSTTAPIALIGS